jgi:hypothetical protein
MQDIGAGINYRIAVDQEKNRVYFWFFGDIMGVEGTRNLLEDTRKACDALLAGFTGIADFTEMTLLGLPDTAQEVQRILMSSGISKMASVWGRETFGKMVVDSTALQVAHGAYEQKRRVFYDRTEAEIWLDA